MGFSSYVIDIWYWVESVAKSRFFFTLRRFLSQCPEHRELGMVSI